MGSPSNTFNTHQQQGFVLIDIHSFVQDEGLRFPLNAHNQELLSALNQYLAAGKASGAFETLFQRWLSQ